MIWAGNRDRWRWRFAILPIYVGGADRWMWLEPYYARHAGEYTEVRTVAEHRADLSPNRGSDTASKEVE